MMVTATVSCMLLLLIAGMIFACWAELTAIRALLAQRIEHEPSKFGVEGSNPSERTTPYVTTFNEGSAGEAREVWKP